MLLYKKSRLTKSHVQDTFQVSTLICLPCVHVSDQILSAPPSPNAGKFLLLSPAISFPKRAFSISQLKAVKWKTEVRMTQGPGGISNPPSHSLVLSSISVYKPILLLFWPYYSHTVGFIWTSHPSLPIISITSRDPASSRQGSEKCHSLSRHLNQVGWLMPILCLFLTSGSKDSPESLVCTEISTL